MAIFNQTECLTLQHAAINYLIKGYSVIPLIGKKCVIYWTLYQQQRATAGELRLWEAQGQFKNLGLVCGKVSGNLVVIDLDGAHSVDLFQAAFPAYLEDTFTVKTGSGGLHVYLKCDNLPANRKVRFGEGHSGVEIRGNGQYVVAVPSIHPLTNAPYEILNRKPVLRVFGLSEVNAWLDTLAPAVAAAATKPAPAATERPGGARSMFFWPARVTNPQAWTNAAVSNECRAVQAAAEGSRNDRLFEAAYNLGQIVAIGWLTRSGAESALLTAARAAGLPDSESFPTIQSGLTTGIDAPRDEQWQKRNRQ